MSQDPRIPYFNYQITIKGPLPNLLPMKELTRSFLLIKFEHISFTENYVPQISSYLCILLQIKTLLFKLQSSWYIVILLQTQENVRAKKKGRWLHKKKFSHIKASSKHKHEVTLAFHIILHLLPDKNQNKQLLAACNFFYSPKSFWSPRK